MEKEWFATKELAGIGGLPSTSQGINQKAKREKWEGRQRLGIQGGKAIEYHIESLPNDIRSLLHLREQKASYHPREEQDPLAVWITAFHQLTVIERERLIHLIIRDGINGLISKLSLNDDE